MAQYSGVILNSRNIENEEALVKKALEEIGGRDQCLFFREAHPFRKRKPRAKPSSKHCRIPEMAGAYQKLAENILNLSAEVENNYE